MPDHTAYPAPLRKRHVVQVPVISAYQPNPSLPGPVIDGIVHFFAAARDLAPGLTDGSAAPAYNLRTLARAMQYVAHAAPLHGLQRALFDGFGMSFAGMLDAEGAAAVEALLLQHVLGGRAAPALPSPSKSAPAALDQRRDLYVNVEVRLLFSACSWQRCPQMQRGMWLALLAVHLSVGSPYLRGDSVMAHRGLALAWRGSTCMTDADACAAVCD
eukprot:jgi/Ulvmu1/4347/UM002_0071.1